MYWCELIQKDILISLTLTCILWHVPVKLGDHSAATVGRCIIRLGVITLPRSLSLSVSSEVKWKITDTDTIMRVCVKRLRAVWGQQSLSSQKTYAGSTGQYRIGWKRSTHTHFLSLSPNERHRDCLCDGSAQCRVKGLAFHFFWVNLYMIYYKIHPSLQNIFLFPFSLWLFKDARNRAKLSKENLWQSLLQEVHQNLAWWTYDSSSKQKAVLSALHVSTDEEDDLMDRKILKQKKRFFIFASFQEPDDLFKVSSSWLAGEEVIGPVTNPY